MIEQSRTRIAFVSPGQPRVIKPRARAMSVKWLKPPLAHTHNHTQIYICIYAVVLLPPRRPPCLRSNFAVKFERMPCKSRNRGQFRGNVNKYRCAPVSRARVSGIRTTPVRSHLVHTVSVLPYDTPPYTRSSRPRSVVPYLLSPSRPEINMKLVCNPDSLRGRRRKKTIFGHVALRARATRLNTTAWIILPPRPFLPSCSLRWSSSHPSLFSLPSNFTLASLRSIRFIAMPFFARRYPGASLPPPVDDR